MAETNLVQSGDKLQKGLSVLYNMELDNYLMTRNILLLDKKISKLGRRFEIDKPIKEEVSESLISGSATLMWMFGCGGAVVGAIIGAIVGMIVEDGFFGSIIMGIIYGVIGIPIGAVVAAIIGIICGIIGNLQEKKQIEHNYEVDCRNYNVKINNQELRIKKELQQKKFLEDRKASLQIKLRDSKKVLEGFYDTVGIDRDYRNIVPIYYMLRFVRLGISNKLKGTDGLYYLIMQELKWEHLKYTLAEICDKLDQLNANAEAMRAKLNEINGKCDRIVQGLEKVSTQLDSNGKISQKILNNTNYMVDLQERQTRLQEYQTFMLDYTILS